MRDRVEPRGLRIQCADGAERVPDAVLYGGREHWSRWRPGRPRLDRWEVYVVTPAEPIGFSADTLPGHCSIVFHVRLLGEPS